MNHPSQPARVTRDEIIKSVTATRFINKWVEIVLTVVSIVQGLAFSDLAQRFPKLYDHIVATNDYTLATYYVLSFCILLRVFQTYVVAALDYEEWNISFSDVLLIFLIGSIEYFIFSSLTATQFDVRVFHSRLLVLSALGLFGYLSTLLKLRPKQFPLVSLYDNEVHLQRLNIAGSAVLCLVSAVVVVFTPQSFYLPAGIIASVTVSFNIWYSLKKTISLRIQIIRLPSQTPGTSTSAGASTVSMVRPGMASDVEEIASILTTEFYYVYEALFETSPALTKTLLERLLCANGGDHNLGYRSFFVAVTPGDQEVIGIILISPPRKYGSREWRASLRFGLTLLRYLGVPRVARILRNMRTLSTIVPLSAPGEMNISYIAVNSLHRRRAVGSQLVRFATAYAEGVGAGSVLAEVREATLGGREFFERNGFEEVAILKSASDAVLSHGPRILMRQVVRKQTEVVVS